MQENIKSLLTQAPQFCCGSVIEIFYTENMGGTIMENQKNSTHPYEPYIPENATNLIVGTIPPYRFCPPHIALEEDDVDFYYGSGDNYFWYLLSEVTGRELIFKNTEEAISQRKKLLKDLQVGITDMVGECIHRGQKSDDNSLEIIKLKDLKKLLSERSKIDTLIYTSQFVASLVNKCADKTYHYWIKPSRQGCIYIGEKLYRVIVLYSPSRSANRSVSEEDRLKQYRAVFGKK